MLVPPLKRFFSSDGAINNLRHVITYDRRFAIVGYDTYLSSICLIALSKEYFFFVEPTIIARSRFIRLMPYTHHAKAILGKRGNRRARRSNRWSSSILSSQRFLKFLKPRPTKIPRSFITEIRKDLRTQTFNHNPRNIIRQSQFKLQNFCLTFASRKFISRGVTSYLNAFSRTMGPFASLSNATARWFVTPCRDTPSTCEPKHNIIA